jgi:signal transduction histidine kinase
VRVVIDTVEPLVQTRALHATLADAVLLSGNPDHLRRLVVNLLDNALKFTPAHGAITVNLAIIAGRATLRIGNSGPAIPAADLPRIFDRFFRGRAPGQPGSGLGLSLCQAIARLHGGVITAANRPGGGVAFVLSLPVAGRSPELARPSAPPTGVS